MDDIEYLKGLKTMRSVWRKIIELNIFYKGDLPEWYLSRIEYWNNECLFCEQFFELEKDGNCDCPLAKEYRCVCGNRYSPFTTWDMDNDIDGAVDILMVVESEIARLEG